MKSSISKKFTLTNAIILIISLSILCFVISSIYKNHTYAAFTKQLIVENRLSNELYKNGINEPSFYRITTDSVNLIYELDEKNELALVYTSNDSFNADFDISSLLSQVIRDKKSVISIKINGEEHLCAVSTVRDENSSKINTVVLSLLSTSNIKSVTNKFYWALIICVVILSIISIIITRILSNRITKPIKKLTSLTKNYASRDFNEKYIADTNDEIRLLSESINTMADSLQAHDKEKARLYRNISHELKTPLTAVYGYAEGIKTGVFNDTSEPLDIIMKESLRIKEYAENIILLSKLESEIEIYKFAPCNISDIIENAIKSIESIAILNDIDINYMPTALPDITLDKDKIFISLNNILSNCIKYTKDTINIESSQDENSIILTISDNGSGFDKEAIDNIIAGVAYEKSNGSGLGLSIVKEIITKHKGEFTISNLPDGGAVFRIILQK